MSWRKREDAFDEAKRLGALSVVKSLGWSKRKLEQEMELADSEKMFKGRLRNAIQREAQREASKARLLHRDSSRGYTADPHLSLVGEPEAVPESYQADLAAQGRKSHAEFRSAEKAEEEARASATRAGRQLRDVATRMARMGLDPTPMLADLQVRLAEAERKTRDAA